MTALVAFGRFQIRVDSSIHILPTSQQVEIQSLKIELPCNVVFVQNYRLHMSPDWQTKFKQAKKVGGLPQHLFELRH